MSKQTIVVADKTTLDKVRDTVTKIDERVSGSRAQGAVCYGVQIDKHNSDPEKRIIYTDDAVGMTPAKMDFANGVFDYGDWGEAWFIRENVPVMLRYDGVEDYELDPNDYTKKKDGTASDVSNPNYRGNAMSKIPLVYVSFTQDSNYEYIRVSNVKWDDSFFPIAHQRTRKYAWNSSNMYTSFTTQCGVGIEDVLDEDARVKVEPYIYLSCFKGSEVNTDGYSRIRSIAGKPPIMSKTAIVEMTYAKNNARGTNFADIFAEYDEQELFHRYCTRTWGQRQLINALLTIISKSDNSQAAFGYGLVNTYVNDASKNYGMTNAGNLMMSGQFYGYNDMVHNVKVFHMEDWWGCQWERIAGLINNYGHIMCSFTGPYPVSSAAADYTNAGYVDVTDYAATTEIAGEYVANMTPQGSSGGYATEAYVSNVVGRLPYKASGGSASTYLCDGLWFNNNQLTCLMVDSHNKHLCNVGVQATRLNQKNSYEWDGIGACLSFI